MNSESISTMLPLGARITNWQANWSPLAQLVTSVCEVSCEIASAILMLYQSAEAWNPSRNEGWNTMPAVVVSAFSGFTSGLPPEKLVPDTEVGGVLDVSLTVKP